MSAISPKKSPKREVVDLTDESDADTKSPTKVLGKRRADSEPEHQSPTKEAKSNDTKAADAEDPLIIDCTDCVVIMGIHEEPDLYVWLRVPEDRFNLNLRPIAQKYGFKGESMLQYMRKARCVPDDDDDDEDGKTSEGNAITAQLDAWGEQGYLISQREPQLKNIKYFVTVYISD